MPELLRRLAVLVDDDLCGTIVEGAGLVYEFMYAESWTAEGRPALSLALPNDGSAISQASTRAYFGGLLPEGGARRQVAEREGVDELDDLALLALLGRECAGAITIVPIADDGSFDADRGPRSAQWLDADELSQLITLLRVAGSDDPIDRYSVSLAGATRSRPTSDAAQRSRHSTLGTSEPNAQAAIATFVRQAWCLDNHTRPDAAIHG